MAKIKLNSLLKPDYFLRKELPPKPPSADNPLPANWLSECAGWYYTWCQQSNIRPGAGEVDVASKDIALTLLRYRTNAATSSDGQDYGKLATDYFQQLYRSLKVDEKERAIVWSQLHGGLCWKSMCHRGFLTDVQNAIASFSQPTNLVQLLTLIRSDMAQEIGESYVKTNGVNDGSDIHRAARIRYYAGEYVQAVPFAEFDSSRHITEDVAFNALKITFDDEYLLFTILNRCAGKIRDQLNHYGYDVSRSLRQTKYTDGEVQNFWSFFARVLRLSAKSIDYNYFKLDSNGNYIDVNFDKIKTRILALWIEEKTLNLSNIHYTVIKNVLEKTDNSQIVNPSSEELKSIKKLFFIDKTIQRGELLNSMSYWSTILDQESFLKIFNHMILAQLDSNFKSYNTIINSDKESESHVQNFIDFLCAIFSYDYDESPKIQQKIQNFIENFAFFLQILMELPVEKRINFTWLLDEKMGVNILFNQTRLIDTLVLLPADDYDKLGEKFMSQFFTNVTNAEQLRNFLLKLSESQQSALIAKMGDKFRQFIRLNNKKNSFFKILEALTPTNYSTFIDALEESGLATEIVNENQPAFFDYVATLPAVKQQKLMAAMSYVLPPVITNKEQFQKVFASIDKIARLSFIRGVKASVEQFLDSPADLAELFKGIPQIEHPALLDILLANQNAKIKEKITALVQRTPDLSLILDALNPTKQANIIKLVWPAVLNNAQVNQFELLKLLNGYPTIINTINANGQSNIILDSDQILAQHTSDEVLGALTAVSPQICEQFFDKIMHEPEQREATLWDNLLRPVPQVHIGMINMLGKRLGDIVPMTSHAQLVAFLRMLPPAAHVQAIKNLGVLDKTVINFRSLMNVMRRLPETERYAFWCDSISAKMKKSIVNNSNHIQFVAIKNLLPKEHRATLIKEISKKGYTRHRRSVINTMRSLPMAERYAFWCDSIGPSMKKAIVNNSNRRQFMAMTRLLPQEHRASLIKEICDKGYKRHNWNTKAFFKYRRLLSNTDSARFLVKSLETNAARLKKREGLVKALAKQPTRDLIPRFADEKVKDFTCLFDAYVPRFPSSMRHHHNTTEATKIVKWATENPQCSLQEFVDQINIIIKDLKYNPNGTFASLVADVLANDINLQNEPAVALVA